MVFVGITIFRASDARALAAADGLKRAVTLDCKRVPFFDRYASALVVALDVVAAFDDHALCACRCEKCVRDGDISGRVNDR